MPGFLEQLFLEDSNIVQGGLGVLFAGDRQIILLLTLYEQLEELRDMPGVLLPIETRRPGTVPRAVGYVFGIVIDRLDRTLAACGCKLMLHFRGKPPFDEIDRFLDLRVGGPGHEHKGLTADVRPAGYLAVGTAKARHQSKGNLVSDF